VSSFSALKDDLATGSTDQIVFYVFDLLYLDGYVLTGAPLDARKAALADIVAAAGDGVIRLSEHVVGQGPEFFEKACGLGLEGIVSKRRDAP
jgi:bifunctional non-homologous end joining protein LigD